MAKVIVGSKRSKKMETLRTPLRLNMWKTLCPRIQPLSLKLKEDFRLLLAAASSGVVMVPRQGRGRDRHLYMPISLKSIQKRRNNEPKK